MFRLKQELAIELLDLALCDGDLRPWVWPPPDRAITGAHEERLLSLQWRVYALEHRRQMIRAGTILAPLHGDVLQPYDRWLIVLETEEYAAWRQQLVRKWTPISVSEVPATADHAVAEPVRREHAEPFDKGMPDREQRPKSVNTSASSAHPGDSPAEASTRASLANLMREDPKNNKRRIKDEVKEECQKEWGVSNRAFNIIWATCIQETGAVAYKKRGPRGEHKRRK
jgi:hypothetical protein